MRLFKKLRRKLDYLTDEQIEQIRRAYLTAVTAHHGQRRHTGEAYITHPVAVAALLADMKMDYQTLMAALLHDVIEDSSIDKNALAQEFGQTVAELVDGVSKLTRIEFVSRAEAQAENFRKMMLAMSRDIRVIIIKLNDRLHNMRTIMTLPQEKRRRIAQETLEIFAPIARRLGMHDLAVELEELGFMARYPWRYSMLKKAVEETRQQRKKVLNLVSKTLQEALAKSHLPACTVTGREKPLSSIYRKMQSKHLPFHEIMDVYAFRIIVDDVDTCYRVLGLVHRVFKPVPEKFKDYIAIPKANGYQSLHTVLFGPYGYPIEVQIRTTEMDHRATSGVAAHWLYKNQQEVNDPAQVRAQLWVKNLLELQRDTGSPLEFIENVKMDLFPDEVYVFTPKGKIIRFPSGATVIDFAYTVHTDIGNTCVAAKINRQLAPLSSCLQNGQTIEIITDSAAHPSPSWLDFVVTRQARNGIRQFLKDQRKTHSIVMGEKLLQQALRIYHLSLKKIPAEVMDFVLKETQLNQYNDLLNEIGLGHRLPALVAKRLMDILEKFSDEGLPFLNSETPILVRGTEGLVVHFAECCFPIPGDPIIGTLVTGKGVLIHVDRCPRLDKLRRHPDSFISLRWDENIQKTFPIEICIEALDEPRLLAKMAASIADADANISDIRIKNKGGQHYQFIFKIFVHNRIHLAKVLRHLRRIPVVSRITRGFEEQEYETND